MAHFDLEEQEQLDAIKTWWKMYGNLVTAVVAAIAIGVVSWQGWQWHQRTQSAQAAVCAAVVSAHCRACFSASLLASCRAATPPLLSALGAGVLACSIWLCRFCREALA